MEIKVPAVAGTMESSDAMVRVEPKKDGGIEIELESSVEKQFGRQIRQTIREVAKGLGVENACITVIDKGALDCTMKARTAAALFRAAQSENYEWAGENK